MEDVNIHSMNLSINSADACTHFMKALCNANHGVIQYYYTSDISTLAVSYTWSTFNFQSSPEQSKCN